MMDRCYEKEVLEDGVVVFKFRATSRQCIDTWFEDVAMVFAQAREQQVVARLIYDVRGVSSLTPYALRRAQELAKLPLPDDWRVATLTNSSFASSIINFIRAVSLLSSDMLSRSQVFANDEAALAWLRETSS